MPPAPQDSEVTRCLNDLRGGDRSAIDRLLPHVYDDLHRLAAEVFRERFKPRSLQPTVLVHECYLRLVQSDGHAWNDRRHFFNVAAIAMRQLLANHARDKAALKRGGGSARVEFGEGAELEGPGGDFDVIELDDALRQLAELDERQARIVELRFLAGLSVEETADVLGVSERTVYVDWQMARSWLSRRLS